MKKRMKKKRMIKKQKAGGKRHWCISHFEMRSFVAGSNANSKKQSNMQGKAHPVDCPGSEVDSLFQMKRYSRCLSGPIRNISLLFEVGKKTHSWSKIQLISN